MSCERITGLEWEKVDTIKNFKEVKVMQNRILLVLLAVVLTVGLIGIGCPPPVDPVDPAVPVDPVVPEVFTLRIQTVAPVGTPAYNVFVDTFIPRLKEVSGGRLIIEPFGSGMIVPDMEAYDAVALGVLDGMVTSSAFWVGKEPAHLYIRGALSPFTEHWHHEAWLWYGGGIDIAREVYARGGLYFVGPVMFPPESLHFEERITSIAEFKGTKIRTPPGPTSALFKAIGGTPVAVPVTDIYSALDRGLVDAAEWMGLTENFAIGVHEVTRYFLWPSFHGTVNAADFVLSMEAWNKLPDDLKALLEVSVRENSVDLFTTMYLLDMEVLRRYLDAGNTRVFWPEKDLAIIAEKIERILAEMAGRSPLADKIFRSQMQFVEALGLR
jgi:TRAP-type mannitol/chloroaromatic compound transport system substrate-binding protein